MVQGAFKEDALKGKTIVLTGGGTGLGKAMGSYFSELGANLVIASRRFEVSAPAAEEIRQKTGSPVSPVACDIRIVEDVDKLWEASEARFGTVHVVINHAAGNSTSPTERLSANALSTPMDNVLTGTVTCTLTLG